jgi:hypothetical protein
MYREYGVQGRWPSPDPLGPGAFSLADPQSLNRYAYVLNNPGTFIDPLGLCPDGQQSVVGSNGEPGCVANPESVVDTVNGGPPPPAPWDYYRFLGEAGPNGCGPFGCPENPPPDSVLYAIAARLAQRAQNHLTRAGETVWQIGRCTVTGKVGATWGETVLDAVGIIPGGNDIVHGVQFASGIAAVGVSLFGDVTGAGLSATGVGLQIADKTGAEIAVHGVEMIPVAGNLISLGATAHDIIGSNGMIAAYKACMSGTN